MSAVGIIPARYGSTRLPAKALADLAGKPMIQHVYEQARKATLLDDVVIATDHDQIVQAALRFGARAVMTSPEHRSGTDRIAEVARQLDAQVVLNIQGDEPLVHPSQLDHLVEFLTAHPAVPVATVMTKLERPDDIANPNVVKVVADQDGYALYFSRSPIPFYRDRTGDRGQGTGDVSRAPRPASPIYWKHLGLYGYQRYFLLQFPHLAPTALEQAECLEQLRVLEHGYKIKVLETAHDTVSVDTADDLKRAAQVLVSR